MVKASEKLAVLSAEAPMSSPVITDGSAFYQLQEEMRTAFECTVVDLPRAMLVQHPHLSSEIQIAVLVTELTLAAARDTTASCRGSHPTPRTCRSRWSPNPYKRDATAHTHATICK